MTSGAGLGGSLSNPEVSKRTGTRAPARKERTSAGHRGKTSDGFRPRTLPGFRDESHEVVKPFRGTERIVLYETIATRRSTLPSCD